MIMSKVYFMPGHKPQPWPEQQKATVHVELGHLRLSPNED